MLVVTTKSQQTNDRAKVISFRFLVVSKINNIEYSMYLLLIYKKYILLIFIRLFILKMRFFYDFEILIK